MHHSNKPPSSLNSEKKLDWITFTGNKLAKLPQLLPRTQFLGAVERKK